jgi:hypothetical protein
LKGRIGNVVAIRLDGEGTLQVGVVSPTGVRWVRPEAAMTEAQAAKWAGAARFRQRG